MKTLATTHVTREGARSSDAGLSSLHEATLPDRGREGAEEVGRDRQEFFYDASHGIPRLHVCGSEP